MEELESLLESNIVTFTFTKKNGNHRIAHGTRDLNLIPERKKPKGTGSAASGVIPFYDYLRQAWRSVKPENLFGKPTVAENNKAIKGRIYLLKGLDNLLTEEELKLGKKQVGDPLRDLLSESQIEENVSFEIDNLPSMDSLMDKMKEVPATEEEESSQAETLKDPEIQDGFKDLDFK